MRLSMRYLVSGHELLVTGHLSLVSGSWRFGVSPFVLSPVRYKVQGTRKIFRIFSLEPYTLNLVPQLIKIHPTYGSEDICNHIQKIGVTIGNEILVNFITDSINRC